MLFIESDFLMDSELIKLLDPSLECNGHTIENDRITKQLGIKEAAVSRLITKLLQADIIEPVSGYGKGKYRFKSN